jgi:hypothetical protein
MLQVAAAALAVMGAGRLAAAGARGDDFRQQGAHEAATLFDHLGAHLVARGGQGHENSLAVMAREAGTTGNQFLDLEVEQGQGRGRRRNWSRGLGRSGTLIWKLVIHHIAKLAWGLNGSKPENGRLEPGKGSCLR